MSLTIAIDDYLNFIENIAMEHDKMLNERDPELSKNNFDKSRKFI